VAIAWYAAPTGIERMMMIGMKSKIEPITFKGLRDFLGGVWGEVGVVIAVDYTLIITSGKYKKPSRLNCTGKVFLIREDTTGQLPRS
jgi:hypothetical protein